MSQDKVKDLNNVILVGKVNIEVPSQVQLVRIFTSSTFTDTSNERNLLMEKVYPKLKEYCQSIGYDFQVVDMRWGIRDEATDDHMTAELCLREIQGCQKLSTGPNFITFLGQKYGYRPFPPKIPTDEFNTLLKKITNDGDIQIVNKWFKRDNNIVPPMFILQSISSILPHYNNPHSTKEQQTNASNEWWQTFERLQLILRKAAQQSVLDESAVMKYSISVTENEIVHGILKAEDINDHCLWFHRDITNIKDNLNEPKSRFFIDKSNHSLDDEALSLLQTLKDDKMSSTLGTENVINYNVKWFGAEGIDAKKSTEHQSYLKNFTHDFLERVIKMIDKGVAMKKKNDMQNKLSKEICKHIALCQKRCKVFHGRSEIIDSIMSYIEGDATHPLAIYGKSGCGKTSLLAMAVMEMNKKFEDRAVVFRFIGTTSDSGSVNQVLYSVCCQIAAINEENTDQIPLTTDKLIEFLPTLLENFSKDLTIVLDSLDQLLPSDNSHALKWLPRSLPSNVKLIVSTLPEDEYHVFPVLKQLLPPDALLEVPVLPVSAASLILDAWLRGVSKKLSNQQEDIVIDAFKLSPSPLFLKLSFDEAIRWKSYSTSKETVLQKNITDSIMMLLMRLEHMHGSKLVGRALGYLTAAKEGLTDNEVDDLLSIDDDVLNDVYQYWTPPIRRIPPLLWIRVKADLGEYIVSRGNDNVLISTWYHRQFFEIARKRYMITNTARILHDNLADYFMGTWSGGRLKPFKSKDGSQGKLNRHLPAQPNIFKGKGTSEVLFNLRKLNELPYHLIHSKQQGLLKDQTLCNFDFLYCKLKAFGLQAVIEDFNSAIAIFPDDKELVLIRDTLQLSAAGLFKDGDQLPCQLVARLQDHTSFSSIRVLLADARNSSVPCFYPSMRCFESPGGALVHTLAGHKSAIQWMSLSTDGKQALTVSQDNTIRVWDILKGNQIRVINSSVGYNMGLWYCKDQCVALIGYAGFTGMVLESEEITYEDPMLMGIYGKCAAIGYHGKRLVHAGNEKISIFDTATKTIKVVTAIEHKQETNEAGFTDIIVAGGDWFIYSRGVTKEFHIRRFSDPNFKKKVKTDHDYFHFAISPAGKSFVTLSSPSSMNEPYKQVFLSVYSSTTWTVEKSYENQMNYMIINLQDSSICPSPEGPVLIAPTMFQINFWNIKTGKEKVALKSGYQGNQYKQSLAGDGRHLAVTSLDFNVHAFHVYDMENIEYQEESEKELSDIDKARAYVGKGEREMLLHPSDPNTILSIPPVDPWVTLWDVTTGTKVKTVRFENMFPSAMLLTDDKQIIAYEYNLKKIFYVDYINGLMMQAIDADGVEFPNAYANTWSYIGNNQLLLLAPNKSDLNVWDLKTGRIIRSIKTGLKKVGNFIVSRDRKVLFGCEKSDDYSKSIAVHVVDVVKGKRITAIKAEGVHFDLRPEVTGVSDNGKLFCYVSKGTDKVCLVDAQTGNLKFDLKYTGDKNEVIGCTVISMVMALNGGYVAAGMMCQVKLGGEDDYSQESQYRLVVWNISTGRCLAWHKGGHFTKMTTTEDGNRMLTISTAAAGETQKAVELWEMKGIQSGHIQMFARFIPETDIRFCYMNLQGNTVCVGMAGLDGIVFFVPCGEKLKPSKNKDQKSIPETKVTYHHKPKK